MKFDKHTNCLGDSKQSSDLKLLGRDRETTSRTGEYMLLVNKKEAKRILYLVEFWDDKELHDKLVKSCMFSEGFYITPTNYNSDHVHWIEELTQRKFSDGRKSIVIFVLLPYWKNVQKLTLPEATDKLIRWLTLCHYDEIEKFVFTFKYNWARLPGKILPLSAKNFVKRKLGEAWYE